MNAAPTRREALIGLAVTGALASVSSPASSKVSGSAWDMAVLRWERAKQHKAAIDARYDAAFERFEAIKPDASMIDRRAFPTFCHPTQWELNTMNVSDMLADFEASRGVTWWGSEEAAEKQRTAIRSIGKYQEQRIRAQTVTGVGDLGDAADAAGDAACDAWATLLKTPAPNGEALIFKLEQLIGDEGRTGDDGDRYGDSWSADLLDAALADARRLLAAGRA